MRIRSALAGIACTAVATATFAIALPSAAYADDGATTTAEVTAAIEQVDTKSPSLVADAAPTTTDADSAAQTTTVDVPIDATKGVTLKAQNGQTIKFGIPGAQNRGKGVKTRNGRVAYSGKDGTGVGVIPATVGVQFLTTIEDRRTTKVEQPITMPQGGKIVVAPDGKTAAALDANNKPIAYTQPAWAKDAHGNTVESRFSTNGKNLAQHVASKSLSDDAFPVVMDPFWLPVSVAVVVGALQTAFYTCGAGYLAGMAWHVAWGNSWAWEEVRRSGRIGCVEAVVARFIPWSWIKQLLRLR